MTRISSLTVFIILFFSQMENAHAQCHIDDWTALKAFYESTDGDNWTNRSGWDMQVANRNSPPTNCNLEVLHGVEIAVGRIKALNIKNNNLQGSIPGEIEKMVDLEFLILTDNKLVGTIPNTITNLTKLNTIILKGNNLIGSLPNEIGKLNNLRQIYVNFNQLSGNIPPSIGDLGNLFALGLDNNQLTGSIPTSIGNLSSLQQLWLQGNCLTGNIPAEIGDINTLNRLAISVNNLYGCFPDNLKKLCTQITDPSFNTQQNIDNRNDFNARWADFCTDDSGSCGTLVSNQNTVATNYSGNVNIETTISNNQANLRNNHATLYNHCTNNCDAIKILDECSRVSGFNNLSANEALWSATKASTFMAPYFLSYHNTVLSPVNIIVNYTCDLQESVFKPVSNTIILGKGDGVLRNSMAAPDVVAHEYAHYILRSIDNLNLVTYGIPGAISESFADIFGEVIEYYSYGTNDWVFGGQVMTNTAAHKGIRSLSNPKDNQMRYQLPNTYKGEHWVDTEDVCFHNDLCGIHTNCGVHNYWFYLLANGGSGINDHGDAYTINGIGIEKAFDIVFDNFSTHLQAGVSYQDVMLGSIQSAKALYGEVSNEANVAIEAWRAVGLDYLIQNPIEFKLLNVEENTPMLLPSGETIIPVAFDLAIDSLGQDLTADNLCFTLHLPEGFLDFELEEIYPPLTLSEVDIVKETGEVEICIDRQNTGAQKTSKAVEKIVSEEPIVRGAVCIEVIDIGGEENIIEPLNISGYTKINTTEIISFSPDNLVFGFDENDVGLTLEVNYENCNTLGSVKISAIGNPPFTFHLRSANGSSIESSPTISNTTYHFNNLEGGDYEVVVFDKVNRPVIENFNLGFIADLNGSFCCANNVVIPEGLSNSYFNATQTISLSYGTLITEGVLEICE